MKSSFPAFAIFFAILLFLSRFPLGAANNSEWELLDLQYHSDRFYRATSELNDDTGDNLGPYGMHNLFDDNLQTCWAEGAKGPGIGESLYLNIREDTRSIRIANGYQKSPVLFAANNRIKTLKAGLFIGISLPGEVTERFTIFHAGRYPSSGVLSLTDNPGFQQVTLPFDWELLRKFKKQITADFFAGKNIEHSVSQPDIRYILQLRIMDVYHSGKYDDTCVSEISTATPDESPAVMDIYLNATENALLMDTEADKKIVLARAPDAVFQLVALSSDKQWVIVIKMPAETGDSRVETSYLLYNTRLKTQVASELLGPEVGDLYDFTQKENITYLNYLNNKTMSIESLDLGAVAKKLSEK